MRNERRAVITGMGVIAPGGVGTRHFWSAVTAGRTATRRITLFDPERFRCQIAAECDFDPASLGATPQEIRRMDRAVQMAVAATGEALADAGVGEGDLDPARTGVTIGNAVGSTMMMEEEYVVISDSGRKWLCDEEYGVRHLYGAVIPSTAGVEVARRVGAEGPTAVVSTGCTSGLDAVGHAAQLIEEGSADVVIGGATDAPISPITVACFDSLKATSTRNDDAAHACRPFDRDRDGLVLGEGSAVFVMEARERAVRRGARIYCEVAGYAGRANAYHMTGLQPDGRELAEAIDRAMELAGISAEDIDYVNAHGSGTRQNDRHETAAFKRSLKDHARRVPVSSIKSMVGHSLGAIGAIEVAASALAIEHGVVPPTANLTTPDPECDLDYVPREAREHPTDVVLSVGSGFGGFQSAVVLISPRSKR
ncbi:beta-ketoacyl-[acyl-carrier-protein] synthase family protein [Streptomyces sp. NPDC005336]|uniref:beta-ketoacyl-[acyl-carrier-protein] synthase family protein n=1 Tax=unclassified Streptomyces TaxID=2593676 RepID=UPI0033A6B936